MNYEQFKKYNYNVNNIVERALSVTSHLIFVVEKFEKRFAVKDKNLKIIIVCDTEEEANDRCFDLNGSYSPVVDEMNRIATNELGRLTNAIL